MKFEDEFETKVEACTYDKWLNIDLEGKFMQKGDKEELQGSICIDIPPCKAIELANMILNHFKS